MTIQELASRTRVAVRQIRFLIAEGFVPPPRGGRARATYDEGHARAIERYAKLRERGFPPAAIKILVENELAAPFPVAPGISLLVDPDILDKPLDIDALVDQVRTLLNEIVKESAHDDCESIDSE